MPKPYNSTEYDSDQREHRSDRRDDQQEVAKEIATVTERVNGLERWQVAQNGSLGRMEAKLDALQTSSTAKFDQLQTSSTAKFDTLQRWMMSSLFTAALALVSIIASHFWKS
jgi:hypothetical protein